MSNEKQGYLQTIKRLIVVLTFGHFVALKWICSVRMLLLKGFYTNLYGTNKHNALNIQ